VNYHEGKDSKALPLGVSCNMFEVRIMETEMTIDSKKELRGFSPPANYTDRAIAAGQQS
jgi:hypothetical protein